MPHIYPAPAPVIAGDTITISRFLNNPTVVQRRVRDLALNRFLGDVLLTGRYETSGGSILYEQGESNYTNRPPEAVAPGGQYPRASFGPGDAALAAVTKWGQDVPITDEHVHRFGRSAVDKGLSKIVNYLTRQVDSICLAAIAAAVTQAQVASSPWTGASKDILLDILLAEAKVSGRDEGYSANALITTDEGFARIVADQKIISGVNAGPSGSNPVLDGTIPRIGSLMVMASNNLPAGVQAMVVDTDQLGGLAYERLESPEYQGDPANGVETWTRRDPDANDQWLVRGRRPIVPVVQEPNAACLITTTGLATASFNFV
jgi:hypothetical protein